MGASSGGSATPLSSAVAVRVPPLMALGASLRASVPEAALVGLGVEGAAATPPMLCSCLAEESWIWPATGSTSFGRGFGSGGCSSCFAAAGERGHEQHEAADQRAADQKLVLLAAPALVRPMWMWLRWATLRRVPYLLKQPG